MRASFIVGQALVCAPVSTGAAPDGIELPCGLKPAPRILIAIIAVLISATACRQLQPAAGPRIDPALATLVPPETSILVGARLDQLRNTTTYQRHFSHISLPRIDDFARETGLDPRRDLQEALFCSDGRDRAVLIVRGKFSTGELEPKLENRGAKRSRYKSYSLFGDERGGVFFMNSSTALAGSMPALREIIDGRDHGSLGIPKTLQPLIASLPADDQFWTVFNGSAIRLPVPDESNLGNINHLARAVQTGAVGADLRSGLSLRAHAACTDDASAKQIHDMLKGLIGLGRLSTPDTQPDLLKVYDAIQVQQQGRDVNVSADVPQDLADRFVNLFVEEKKR